MTLRSSNRTSQEATYHADSPNYVDVSTGIAMPGMFTFDTTATDESWADGDTLGVLVHQDNSNFWVGTGTWDATNSYIELTTEEDSAGTLTDTGEVVVSLVLTNATLLLGVEQPATATFQAQTGTAYTLLASDSGKVICSTNAAATVITLDDALPVGFHCIITQEGAGAVSITPEGTDTVNGAGAAVDVSGQWGSAYVYQRTAGAWVVTT